MTTGITLCVDDDTTVLNALRAVLVDALGDDHVIEIAESGQEALELCEEIAQNGQEISLAISDYLMPTMRGDEFLVRLHELSPNTIKIMLTGQSNLQGVKRAINEASLYRFLEKPFNNSDLALTVKGALRAYHQDRELEKQNQALRRLNAELEDLVAERTQELVEKNIQLSESNQQLERLSVTDRLTGLYNRLKLDQVLEDELVRYLRYGTAFALILLDVDKFKSVNDIHGHAAGDLVLIDVAKLLTENTRDVDIVGRWGGEEFLVVCPDTDIGGGVALAEKLRLAIETHEFPVVGSKTSSFGVAAVMADDSIARIMARADAALYRAKEGGRNRVETGS